MMWLILRDLEKAAPLLAVIRIATTERHTSAGSQNL
jgi:hypothetical protein